MIVVTIDTGTTNTRVRVWQAGALLAIAEQPVGVRDTGITGSRARLANGVRTAIDDALAQAGIAHPAVGRYLAAGMITSNMGLHEVPHLPAPAGAEALAAAMVSAEIPGLADQPVWFVPGVRNPVETVSVENCESMDMMRGEEVETIGLMDATGVGGPLLLILPGSHTKFVRVDGEGRIAGSATTLGGELLSVITEGTILAAALERSFARTLDEPMALEGAALARRVGLSRCCFAVRVLDQFTKADRDAKASFLAGAIAATDLEAVLASSALGHCAALPVLVGGSNDMARVFVALMRGDARFGEDLRFIEPAVMREASARGVMRVAQLRGLIG